MVANILLSLNSSLPPVNILTNLLLISSLLSLIIGAIVGLSQIRIKRLLAYSTINHVGFLLLALAVFSSSSIESFIFYILQYTLTNLNIFLIILALSYIINVNVELTHDTQAQPDLTENSTSRTFLKNGAGNLLAENKNWHNKTSASKGTRHPVIKMNISDIEYINSLKGLFYKNPILSLSLAICLFSFAGVPPLIGFFAKQQVLYSSNSAGYFFLSLTAIIVSVISAFYYLKIIKIVFSESAKPLNILETKFQAGFGVSETSDPLLAVAGGRYAAYPPKETPASKKFLPLPVSSSKEDKNEHLTNVHSFIIGILTLSIVIFILNPELLLNSIAIGIGLVLNL